MTTTAPLLSVARDGRHFIKVGIAEWMEASRVAQSCGHGSLIHFGSMVGMRTPVRRGIPWPVEYHLVVNWRSEFDRLKEQCRSWDPGGKPGYGAEIVARYEAEQTKRRVA